MHSRSDGFAYRGSHVVRRGRATQVAGVQRRIGGHPLDRGHHALRGVGFAADNCHAMQHRQVLQVLEDVARAWREEGNRTLIQVLVQELGNWFVAHAQTMDAGLVQLMAEQGFDPETGHGRQPRAAEAPLLTGCGSRACA